MADPLEQLILQEAEGRMVVVRQQEHAATWWIAVPFMKGLQTLDPRQTSQQPLAHLIRMEAMQRLQTTAEVKGEA
eukprot:NODE_4258_length_483_cov_80.767281_g3653_i0.p3 GENE.NODE_4258_length_483_cov_80.767281_g3653_i0~~NODE_4258_length_483_cov_80.767281_g3653_i0.p3  ORF type:complete len:75 (-),score=22.93 NODE_4258_length_483_cov_80.767281_g3653_i0:102-326(-)